MRWVVVMALKSPSRANTRLAPAVASAEHLVELTRAMRADTVAAVRNTAAVADIVYVVDTEGVVDDQHVVLQQRPGLNGALRDGYAYAAERWPDAGVAALVGDLPALRPGELDTALAAAGPHPAAFVADHIGTGTTMLTTTPGRALTPRFGTDSATAHAALATSLDAGPGLRIDVDTRADLLAAIELGVGRYTIELLRHLPFTRLEDDPVMNSGQQ